MSSAVKTPITNAIRYLREHKIAFTTHPYRYEEKGGTTVSARELGVDEHIVIKTLVMENDQKQPLIVLMHGDKQVSLKELARELNVKTISPCKPETADLHSGYQVGGTSPFGTKKPMPILMEKTILDFPCIYINGGARGFLINIDPQEIVRTLQPTLVNVAIDSLGKK